MWSYLIVLIPPLFNRAEVPYRFVFCREHHTIGFFVLGKQRLCCEDLLTAWLWDETKDNLSLYRPVYMQGRFPRLYPLFGGYIAESEGGDFVFTCRALSRTTLVTW